MDAIQALRLSYLTVTAALFGVFFVPDLKRFLTYGSRATDPTDKSSDPKRLPAVSLLDKLAAISVPHSWFASFYATSLASSAFWMLQILMHGRAFEFIANYTNFGSGRASMSSQQVLMVWGLMVAQGGRRLWECLFVMKRGGSSKMHLAHWGLGIWFYLSVGVTVWIEGIPALQQEGIHLMDLHFDAPSLKSFIAVLLYLLAAGVQHDCHAYLASLKTYAVPDHPAFHMVISPHYSAECLIYLALSIGAAPPGHIINRTFACALVFVVGNLGATADNSKRWYEAKFGKASVQGRWRMIPFIY